MTPTEFAAACAALRDAGRIKPGHGWKTDLAAKIGRKRNWVDTSLTRGTDQTADLAIAALLAGLGPYRPEQMEAAQ